MELSRANLVSYYSKPEIMSAIAEFCKDREVAGRNLDGSYGMRPNVIMYPADVLRMIRDGHVSLHATTERWSQPMQLRPGMKTDELDELRTGWDFVIDIDTNFLEHSIIAADLMVKALWAHGVKNVAVKFSGRAGFHIAVPFEAFPAEINGKPSGLAFPEAPRIIATYLQNFIKDELGREFLELEGGPYAFAKKVGKPVNDVTEIVNETRTFNPYCALKIDTILISSRHMVRVPYSLHEKSGLASIPIDPGKIRNFVKEDAEPEKIRNVVTYCGRNGRKNEAFELVNAAYFKKQEKEKTAAPAIKTDVREELKYAMPEENFPPCIKNIMQGVKDGRKRSLFILLTFLKKAGWGWDAIEQRIKAWNLKNAEALPDNYIQGQLNWLKKQPRGLMPRNCSSTIYRELSACPEPVPEECQGLKNPITVASRKYRAEQRRYKA